MQQWAFTFWTLRALRSAVLNAPINSVSTEDYIQTWRRITLKLKVHTCCFSVDRAVLRQRPWRVSYAILRFQRLKINHLRQHGGIHFLSVPKDVCACSRPHASTPSSANWRWFRRFPTETSGNQKDGPPRLPAPPSDQPISVTAHRRNTQGTGPQTQGGGIYIPSVLFHSQWIAHTWFLHLCVKLTTCPRPRPLPLPPTQGMQRGR